MTVDNEEQAPKPQPIPLHSSVNVSMGEAKYEKLSEQFEDNRHPHPWGHGPPPHELGHPPFHGPPPHVRKFMRKRFKRGCCCLMFLILLNLLVACYIAKKVSYISFVLSPDSDVKYMPGGFHPFCSDLCVDLCASSDNENSLNCDVSDCVDACALHFEISMDETDDSSNAQMSLSEDEEEPMTLDQSNDIRTVEDVDDMDAGIENEQIEHARSQKKTIQRERPNVKPVAVDKDRRSVPRGRGFMRK